MKLTPNAFRIFVQDLERAKAFYEEKLKWNLSADGSVNGFLVFEPGNITIVVERTERRESDEEGGLLGRFTGLTLAAEDIYAAVTELKKEGVEFTGGPERQSWGGVLAWFQDVEGNILTLIEQKADQGGVINSESLRSST